MSRCETPLPCCDCCTHRLFDPAIVWSADVWRGHCGGEGEPIPHPQAVVDSWYHGGVYYLLSEIPVRNEILAGAFSFRYRAEAWSPAGERIWMSDWLINLAVHPVTRSPRACIASDGTTVWVAIDEPPGESFDVGSTMWRLDAADGSVLFAGDPGLGQDPQLTVQALQPDAGGVLICHQTTGTGTAFVSTWADDVVTPVVGPPDDVSSTVTAYSVQHDSGAGAYYVGHSLYATKKFAGTVEEGCCKSGYLSRFDGDGALVWLSEPKSQPGFDGLNQVLIKLSGATLFFAERGNYYFGAVETEWGVPEWFRTLEPAEEDATNVALYITDLDIDGDFLWLATRRFVLQLDHAGTVVATETHATADRVLSLLEAEIYSGYHVLTVSADGAGNALGGGVTAKCVVTETPESFSEALPCAEFDNSEWSPPLTCEGLSGAGPDYCHVHECAGVPSNNGRVPIDACTPEQWPPCEGPGGLWWNCGSGVESEEFTFVAEGREGGIRWRGESGAAVVLVDWVCGSGPEVTVTIAGCTVTVGDVSYTCDGPFGYIAVYFTFTLDCGTCTGSGCGAFGDDDCESDGVAVECCEEQLPAALTATLAAPTCAALHGTSVPLTYGGVSGGRHVWSGTFTPTAGCGEFTLEFAIFDGVSCEWAICLIDPSEVVVFGACDGSGDMGTIDCPFDSASWTASIPGCAIDLMTCTGDLTIVVA